MSARRPLSNANRKSRSVLVAALIVISIVSVITSSSLIRPASASFAGLNGKIAYVAWAQHQQGGPVIWSMRPSGASQVQLTHHLQGEVELGPVWSADGSRIVFFGIAGRSPAGPSQIYVMNADGTGRQQLTNDGIQPAWSPDGTKITFASFRTGHAEIYVMKSDGTAQKQLTNTGNNLQPRWSPDGKKIAFVSDRAKNGLTDNIYVMNADGTNQIRLTGPGGGQFGPDWSPDGSKIVFWMSEAGRLLNTGAIWVMNADGSGGKLLNADGLSPAWSPDGNKIVFESFSQGEILMMNADGSGVSELRFPVWGSDPNWQPISQPTFQIEVYPNPFIYLLPGTSSSSEIVVDFIGGFSSPVSLSAAWIGTPPVGVDFYIPSPSVVTPSTSTGNATWPLTISSSTNAIAGNYTLQVTGVSGSLSDSLNMTMAVTSSTFTATSVPDFYMFPCCFPGILTVAQSGNNSATINVNSLNGFNAPVTLTTSWLGTVPTDVSVSFSSNTIGGTLAAGSEANSLLTVTAGAQSDLGLFELGLTGTRYLPYVPANESLTHSLTIPVLITGTTPNVTTSTTSTGVPDFSIASSKSALNLAPGSNTTTTITVTPLNAFNSTVDLSWSWVGTPPSDVFPVWEATNKCFLYPEGWLCPELRVTASPTASIANYTLRVTGNSSFISHSVDVAIVVVPLSASTTSSTYFTGSLISPGNLTAEQTYHTPGSTTGGTTPTAQGGGKCLIATATYGSELAPEVQLLRNFRDNSIMRTRAGSSFMVAFNAWYYTFSPYVANYLTQHWFERAIMKAALYPLIGILMLSQATFNAFDSYQEFAALLSGLVAASLIGAFYVGLPFGLIQSRVRRLRTVKANSALRKFLCISLLSGIALLLAGEVFASSISLIISSITIVLSALVLSAACISRRITKGLRS